MEVVFFIIVLVMSVVIHEVSHGWAALFLGDQTAKHAGRLTLNPIPHIDPIGSILVPFALAILSPGFVFGWAKPVPYNPYNLRGGKWGPAIVAVAGPISNLVLAVFFSFLIRFVPLFSLTTMAGTISAQIVLLNIILAVFNLFPLPPLDGSKILFAILPYRLRQIEEFMVRYQLILIIVLLFSVGGILLPIVANVFSLLTGTDISVVF